MASRVIHSTVFRVSYPHLDKPHAQNPTDQPKYAVSMMIPKTGVCPINNQPTSFDNVIQALNEVTMEEWQLPYDQAIAPGMGIQFPPSFKDGDTVFEKDQNNNPIPGQVRKGSAGMFILSVKNVDPVGCVSADGQTEIHGSAVYAGSWARAELEVSAYTGANGRVVSVKLLNVQLCYNDEKLGGAPVRQSASQAFAAHAVTDTNIQAGQVQQQFAPTSTPAAVPGAPAAAAVPGAPAAAAVPGAPAAAAVPGAPAAAAVPGAPAAAAIPGAPAAAAIPGAPAAAAVPGAPAAAAVPGAPGAAAVPGAPGAAAVPGAPGAAAAVPGAPGAAAVPGAPGAAAVPGAPAAAAVPGAPGAAAVPGAPAAAAVPGAPAAAPMGNTDPVIMNPGEASYAEYAAQGWTPDLLIQHGKAQANYLNPAV